MKRIGQVIKLKPGMEERYKYLHAHPWPEVNDMIRECNIRNYSIFLRCGYLFAYFEYVGDDFGKDMERMSQDPATQRWWKETDPCQEAVEDAAEDEWWADMQEVYHLD